jgi:hypothetical protein
VYVAYEARDVFVALRPNAVHLFLYFPGLVADLVVGTGAPFADR